MSIPSRFVTFGARPTGRISTWSSLSVTTWCICSINLTRVSSKILRAPGRSRWRGFCDLFGAGISWRREISQPSTDVERFSAVGRGLDCDLPVAAVAARIARDVTDRILAADRSRDAGPNLLQVTRTLREIYFAPGKLGDLLQNFWISITLILVIDANTVDGRAGLLRQAQDVVEGVQTGVVGPIAQQHESFSLPRAGFQMIERQFQPIVERRGPRSSRRQQRRTKLGDAGRERHRIG